MGEINHEHQLSNETEETEYESLSLCDLPINSYESKHDDHDQHSFSFSFSSSELPDLFEFYTDDISTEIVPADDLILRWKNLPLNHQQQKKHKQNQKKQIAAICSRIDSLPDLNNTRSNSSKTRPVKHSHSLDDSKFPRSPSANHDSARMKSRWYLLLFGLMKFRPEMDLRDIKSRQVRRTPTEMFAHLDAGSKAPAYRRGKKVSWRLFNVLSCKAHASVAVTSSFAGMPFV